MLMRYKKSRKHCYMQWSNHLIQGTVIISNPWILPIKLPFWLSIIIKWSWCRCMLVPRCLIRRIWWLWGVSTIIIIVMIPGRWRSTKLIPPTTFFWTLGPHNKLLHNKHQDAQNSNQNCPSLYLQLQNAHIMFVYITLWGNQTIITKRDKSSQLWTEQPINFWETEKKKLWVCKIQLKIGERNLEVTNTDSRARETVREFDVPPDSLFEQEHQINYDREKKSAVTRNLARSSQLCSPLSSTSNNFFKISLCQQLLKKHHLILK